MSYGRNVALIYDGSFYGLLSALWYAFENKIIPAEITEKKELLPIFEEITVKTDEKRAKRLMRGFDERIFDGAGKKIFMAYLSDVEDRERAIYEYVKFGVAHGKKTARLLSEPSVQRVERLCRKVCNEAHRLKGFLRFSDCENALVAVTEPSCFALPLVIGHFANRYPDENIAVFDKRHKAVFVSEKGKISMFFADELKIFEENFDEKAYKTLWKIFFNTVFIEERKNEKCQKTHLPVRFWHQLTEMQDENEKNPRKLIDKT